MTRRSRVVLLRRIGSSQTHCSMCTMTRLFTVIWLQQTCQFETGLPQIQRKLGRSGKNVTRVTKKVVQMQAPFYEGVRANCQLLPGCQLDRHCVSPSQGGRENDRHDQLSRDESELMRKWRHNGHVMMWFSDSMQGRTRPMRPAAGHGRRLKAAVVSLGGWSLSFAQTAAPTLRRLAQPSRPSAEPNIQTAAGTGTVVTAIPLDMKLRPNSPLNALLSERYTLSLFVQFSIRSGLQKISEVLNPHKYGSSTRFAAVRSADINKVWGRSMPNCDMMPCKVTEPEVSDPSSAICAFSMYRPPVPTYVSVPVSSENV